MTIIHQGQVMSFSKAPEISVYMLVLAMTKAIQRSYPGKIK